MCMCGRVGGVLQGVIDSGNWFESNNIVVMIVG